MTDPTRTQVANKVYEVAQGVDAVGYGRRIDDIPKDFARADGAREIAILTLTAASHDFELKPVMAALEKLAALDDWSHSFFVAHVTNKRPTFDWREAPMRKYKSFADFYQRELEHTFGTWENLQHTWNEVVKGKKTEQQARAEIAQQLAADPSVMPLATKDQAKTLRAEGGKKGGRGNLSSDTTKVNRGAEYLVRRLKRDHLEIAEALARGEFPSARAAAMAAGIVKPPTALDCLRRAWVKATKKERDTFLLEVQSGDHQEAAE
jgi:hypothetical protein